MYILLYEWIRSVGLQQDAKRPAVASFIEYGKCFQTPKIERRDGRREGAYSERQTMEPCRLRAKSFEKV